MGAGPPLCGGECPSFEACLSVAGDCECRAAAICGNGVLEPSEECDDGNNDDGDGCSANCELEAPAVPTMPLQALVVFAALLLISAFVALLARRNGAQRAPNGR